MKELKKQIYNDAWFFYKKYINVQDTEEFWNAVIRDGDLLIEKYKRDPFMRNLVSCIINELGRKE